MTVSPAHSSIGLGSGIPLSASTTKKVCLRRLDGTLVEGYVSPQTYLRPEGAELMNRSAQVVTVAYPDIRAIYFVRDFGDPPDLESRKTFSSRPKLDGLWVRMTFHDGEVFEGVIPNNLLLHDERGVTFTPPDANSNTQKVFVPSRALQELTVLGVIGSPLRQRRARPKVPVREQRELFGEAQRAASD